MKPVFEAATIAPKKIIYAEGEDVRVLRAAQIVVDEKLAYPLLVGRPVEIAHKIEARTCALSAATRDRRSRGRRVLIAATKP